MEGTLASSSTLQAFQSAKRESSSVLLASPLLALLRQSRMRCRDELIEMMLRRIRRTQAAAKEQLEALHDQHRATEESLIGIFGQVLETEQTQDTDAEFGRQVRLLLSEQGGTAALAEQCETVSAWHRGNDLPLLWPIHAKHRVLLFRLLDLMDVQSATQDRSLLDALAVVSRLRHARRDEVEGDIDLSFASQRWRAFVAKRQAKPGILDRRALEVCVFVHLADALQTGDLFIVEAETFADYRAQLLPWAECEPRLAGYCAALGIPEQGEDFAAALKAELTTLAAAVDADFPANTEFSLDAEGTPHLKQLTLSEQPPGLAEFEGEVHVRLQERHLLDILRRTEHWSRYTRHFGPPSGADPKLTQAIQRYLFTVFGYGCNLGPGQTARHAPDGTTAQTMRRINAQHVTAAKLEAAMVDICRPIRPVHAAAALGRRTRCHRRRHACQAARKQPAGLPAHPLRRLWRHRLPPHRRQLYRAVHQLHSVRRVGSRPHPGRPAEEQVRHPARHTACRQHRASPSRYSACAGCSASS